MVVTYARWLHNDVTQICAPSKNGYISAMIGIFEDDPRSPEEMATPEFFQLVKKDERNRTSNGTRQAAIQYWIQFWPLWKGKEFDQLPQDPKERRRYDIQIGRQR